MVHSVLMLGIEPREVQVETDISDGLPMFSMVGYLASSVREAQARVCTAIRSFGAAIPAKRITVNLSPAGMRKQGARFDLPLAISILAAMGIVEPDILKETIIVGELGLDGCVRPVTGVLPSVLFAKEKGYRRCMIPEANIREGAVVSEIDCIGISDLTEAVRLLNHPEEMAPAEYPRELLTNGLLDYGVDFADICGQRTLRRAAEAAVAGMHNLLMLGPPGAGKTMLARRLPTIFPELTLEETMEISKIYSVMGELTPQQPLIRKRPFRVPHHTLTAAGLCGGGRYPMPGEVSLAHLGVLFLDELTEYPKNVLECLRQPMEDGQIQITRIHGTYVYPSRFMLAAAMNPCPCGYYPDRTKCTCSPAEIRRYLEHISQPLLDRIDICAEARANTYQEMYRGKKGEGSERIRERIEQAAERQRVRFRGTSIYFNAAIPSASMGEYCPLTKRQEQRMEEIFERLELSGRAYHKILKVARTLADLDDSPDILDAHLNEAVCYRSIDKKYWIR